MIYDEWVFHDVEHIYLQLIKKSGVRFKVDNFQQAKKSHLFEKWQRSERILQRYFVFLTSIICLH